MANKFHILLFLLASLASCKVAIKDEQYKQAKLCDSLQNMLHNGDVVLRAGKDQISQLFKLANTKDQQFSHCGISIKEGETWNVYHVIVTPNYPEGIILKESFKSFVSHQYNNSAAIIRFSLDSTQVIKFCEAVKRYYALKIKFDKDYNLKSDDKLYCTELIYKSIIQANNNHWLIVPTVSNSGKEYIAIDNLYEHPSTKIIGKIAY